MFLLIKNRMILFTEKYNYISYIKLNMFPKEKISTRRTLLLFVFIKE